MKDELMFVRCTDEYEDVIRELNREIVSERDITNLYVIDRKRTKLVIHNGNVVGYSNTVLISGNPSFQIGVLKKYRKMGYGRAITERLEEEAFANGYEKIILLISPRNLKSRQVAESCGYSIDYSVSEVELNPDNETAMYITYYKNNYKKIR